MRNTSICTAFLALLSLGSLEAQTARYRDLVFATADRTSNIAYGSAVNRYSKQTETLRLDLYQPRGDRAAKRAAVVVVHGGGFRGGDKGTASFVRMCSDFARRGYVAISINYRLRPRTQPLIRANATDAAHDMKAAVRWLRKNKAQLRLDENRIACIGSSAGAITCCEAAYVPGEGNSGNKGFSSRVHAVVDLWGFLWDLTALDKGEAPVQIIHGTLDRTVPYTHATNLKKRADQVGVPAELHPIQGGGHAPWTRYFSSYHLQHVVPFFYERLALAQVSGLGARPGYRSPGQLVLDAFGLPRHFAVLYVAAGRAQIPVPPLGVLCLDPRSTVFVAAAGFPATPRLPRTSFVIAVPAGVRGNFSWQTLQLDRSRARWLSNCVDTRF